MLFYSESTRRAFVQLGFIDKANEHIESVIGRYLTFCIEDLSISKSDLSYEIVEKRADIFHLKDVLDSGKERYVRQSLVFSAKIINLLESRCLKESRIFSFEAGDQFDKVIPRIIIDVANLEIAGRTIAICYLEVDVTSGYLYLIYSDLNELASKTDEAQQLSGAEINSNGIETIPTKRLKSNKGYLY